MLIGVPVLAVAGFMFAARAQAFGPWGHGARTADEMRERMGRRIEHVLDAVDASDTQRDKVDALVDAAVPKLFALVNEGRTVRAELRAALLADSIDEARIDQARVKLNSLMSQGSEVALHTLSDVAQVLTPAQRKQAADKLAALHH
jgi:Spy/CpxP family protein refolding chaperone